MLHLRNLSEPSPVAPGEKRFRKVARIPARCQDMVGPSTGWTDIICGRSGIVCGLRSERSRTVFVTDQPGHNLFTQPSCPPRLPHIVILAGEKNGADTWSRDIDKTRRNSSAQRRTRRLVPPYKRFEMKKRFCGRGPLSTGG
ncbi:unnamed protein product [Lasius platythorax]|uniref:Uncharacterized protein n=1 Tax=Lasius platythorax TaxID=488582 RepID=A0AAV2NR70_9HYME